MPQKFIEDRPSGENWQYGAEGSFDNGIRGEHPKLIAALPRVVS